MACDLDVLIYCGACCAYRFRRSPKIETSDATDLLRQLEIFLGFAREG
jgi:hypothetical protein